MSNNKMKNSELSYICTQLSMLIDSGISPRDGLELSLDGGKTPMEQAVKKAVGLLDDGQGLSVALEQSGFPTLMTSMISVGESTGSLQQVTASLGRYYMRMEEAKSALSSAVLYPSMIFILMLAVQGVLCVKVLPIMSDALAQSGGQLGGAAAFFALIGRWISSHMALSLGFLALLGAACAACLINIEGFSRVFLRKTGWGRASDRASSISAMALAMRAGADADTALTMALSVSGDKAPVEKCLELMAQGVSFGTAAGGSGLLEPYMARLLDAGVRSGCADTVMEQLAVRLDKAASDKLEKTLSAVEPALVSIMAVMTGFILLSVMSPLASLIASV